MNPALLAQLLNVAADMFVLIEQLKSGMMTDSQGWTQAQADFNSAMLKWNTAISTNTANSANPGFATPVNPTTPA